MSRDLLTMHESGMRSIRGKDISMIFQEPMTSPQPGASRSAYQIARGAARCTAACRRPDADDRAIGAARRRAASRRPERAHGRLSRTSSRAACGSG
ncbi:MAG: hypothetical protein MZV70_13770 [Desulfobacterales bacterium]|nr:hypothetical protein [Desulfobacterales bacterium]